MATRGVRAEKTFDVVELIQGAHFPQRLAAGSESCGGGRHELNQSGGSAFGVRGCRVEPAFAPHDGHQVVGRHAETRGDLPDLGGERRGYLVFENHGSGWFSWLSIFCFISF